MAQVLHIRFADRYAIDADARPADRGGGSMAKHILVAAACFFGAATIETRTAMGMLALDNIHAALGGVRSFSCDLAQDFRAHLRTSSVVRTLKVSSIPVLNKY
jgi:hypothetical protein